MKIAVWQDLGSGGGKRALVGHVKGLKALGHDVEVWSPPSADDSYLPLRDLVATHVVPWTQQAERSFSRAVRLARFGVSPARTGLVQHFRQCAREMEGRGFEIVLGSSSLRYNASGIGGSTDLPSVLYLGEPNRRLTEALPNSLWAASGVNLGPSEVIQDIPYQLRRAVQLREARIALRSDIEWVNSFRQVLVNSYYSRESLLRSYGIDSRVCYLGVDLNVFRLPTSGDRGYAIGVGSVTPIKGIELAINAVAALPQRHRNLVWVGNTERKGYAEYLLELAVKQGVNLNIRVLVSDRDLVRLIQGARAMVCTSSLEPFGFAPVEALACGTPVVAVAEAGYRESIRHMESGLLVNRSVGDIADALKLLYADTTLCEELGQRGRRHVEEHFSLEVAAERLEKELLRVAATDGDQQ